MRLYGQNQRLFLLLLLLMVITTHGVLGRRRRRARGRSSPHAPGPNMCKVQQVLGTKEKFFTHCIAKHLKMICERPTIDVWECCSGFVKQRGKTGCTGEKPLGNIVETARDLRLNGFVQMTGTTGQRDDLSNHGAYTVFAPTDEAMWDASPKKLTELISDENSLPLLKYHTAPGRLNISNFVKRNQQFVTLYDGQKIRINKYAYGVATVNCARIIRPDEKATNGIVHVIDKVLSPHDVDSTLAERVEKDDRFSQFHLAMLVADLARRLNSERGSFTVLAPTNEAFARLPSDLLDQILTDADTAEKVMKRHIVRGVYCADAIVVAVGLKTMDDSRLLFRCKRDGLRVNEARVIHPDITASNGVMHGIDTVLLPDSVKKTTQLLEDMRLSKFMELVAAAGLNMTLDNGGDVTVFSPTDQALGNIPPKYMASL
ncbi:transforming growth factor-beta-induced protein ig-h3, partial [Aplysia californica]|uniref:Transforming growth factor-beta-induced protein ig-h3 n=1 Tax=Aplysia californica TaxID=6500 RepID=A0ABM1A5M2_APLCA